MTFSFGQMGINNRKSLEQGALLASSFCHLVCSKVSGKPPWPCDDEAVGSRQISEMTTWHEILLALNQRAPAGDDGATRASVGKAGNDSGDSAV